jgi:hypothetical protein
MKKEGKMKENWSGKEEEYTPFVVPPAVETQSLLWKRQACPAC